MDKNFFYTAGFPTALYFEPAPTTPWQENPLSSEQSTDCFLTPTWDKSTEPFSNFDSALSSMVSSPGASNSADGLAMQELIGKLRTIDNNSAEVSTPAFMAAKAPYMGNINAGSSVYSTPLNSPNKLQLPVMNQLVTTSSHAMSPDLPALSAADPGFAERAAKFSCFGSRSFNGRTSQFGTSNVELAYRSGPLISNGGKLSRVSSSPSLKVAGLSPPAAANKNLTEMRSTDRSDTKMEESSAAAAASDLNSRKRKAVSKGGKPKESAAAEKNGKRSKSSCGNGGVKVENDSCNMSSGSGSGSDGGKEKQQEEAPKDYIHVRARRGQATDSHSLAERVRREKISERMKLLQDLVPGCNKVTGKAVMLDEIISYVQQLQQQVEFLSMKLASVNPTLEGLLTKDGLSSQHSHPAAAVAYHHHHLDNSEAAATINLFGQQNQYLLNNSQVVVEEEANNNGEFGQGHLFPKLPSFSEDDLHSLVMMGFGEKTNNRTSSELKLELL